MKMKKFILDDPGLVNVFEIETKNIVFTGTQAEAAKFLGVDQKKVSTYVRTKYRFRGKYAIRHKPIELS